MKPYRAVIIGGTGAVGSALIRELIASPLCEGITAIVRNEPADDWFDDPKNKLRVSVIEMDQLGTEAISLARHCQTAFCTMGVGQPRKVAKEQFWKVDVEYAVAFARGCKLAGVQHFSLLSSVGAKVDTRSHYLHVKGVTEERISALGFVRASLFRPSLLVTPKIRYGLQDRIAQTLVPLMSRFLPPRWHEIKVEDLARAMRLNAERESSPGVESLTYLEFQQLLETQSPAVLANGTSAK